MQQLPTLIGRDIDKVIILTDGGNHFVSNYVFCTLPIFAFDQNKHIEWIVLPKYHGKGDCDSHGGVVKQKLDNNQNLKPVYLHTGPEVAKWITEVKFSLQIPNLLPFRMSKTP
jgi:hypothetical protein